MYFWWQNYSENFHQVTLPSWDRISDADFGPTFPKHVVSVTAWLLESILESEIWDRPIGDIFSESTTGEKPRFSKSIDIVPIRISMCCIVTSCHIISLHLCESSKLSVENDHIFPRDIRRVLIFFVSESDSIDIFWGCHGVHHSPSRWETRLSLGESRIDISDTVFSDNLDTIRSLFSIRKANGIVLSRGW